MKRCKGSGKTSGYGCAAILPFTTKSNGIRSYKHKHGLGIDCRCWNKFLLESPEGLSILKKTTLQVTKETRDLESFKQKEKDNKSLGWLIKNTVNTCHKYIRLRDQGKPCISCGEPYNSRHQAGHFYKAELFSSLKFNEFNISNQCVGCNIHKEGNESQYRVNLPKRIGKEQYDKLNELAAEDKIKTHKWDRETLKQIRSYYQQKIKELQ